MMLKDYTKETAKQAISEWYKENPHFSIEDCNCLYRKDLGDGKVAKCAVGVLISDEELEYVAEASSDNVFCGSLMMSVEDLIEHLPPQDQPSDEMATFFRKAQTVHDRHAMEQDDPIPGKTAIESMVIKINELP